MATLVVRLDPGRLDNLDSDIRCVLPDLLPERSGGELSEGGYDYVGDDLRQTAARRVRKTA